MFTLPSLEFTLIVYLNKLNHYSWFFQRENTLFHYFLTKGKESVGKADLKGIEA